MNVENRTIFEGDNLHILRGLDSETIDLIYLDPPFNSNRTYEAPIGSEAAGAAFKDAWTLSDLDNAWHGELAEHEPALYSAISAAEFSHSKGMKAYLIMMGIRMLEMRRVLKPKGSIYLHCDPTASHYLKMVMDAVFGKESFRNEVTWERHTGNNNAKRYAQVSDILLYYAGRGATWNQSYGPLSGNELKSYKRSDPDGRRWKSADLTAPGSNPNRMFTWRGRTPTTRGWAYSMEELENLWERGLILTNDEGIPLLRGRKSYLEDAKGVPLKSIWTDINRVGNTSEERTGFPTQKPLSLLKRIIEASSNLGDIVLDPFCGCATTCVAAEGLQRQWIGIDLSPKAVELVKMRLERDLDITENVGLLGDKVIHRTDIPVREVPDEPRQIHAATLFGTQSEIERVLSEVELRQYRSYKHTLFGVQEGKCNGCEVLFPFRNMTIDHIRPRSRGGSDAPDNLQLLCGACNSTKGNRTQEELIASLRAQGVIREDIQGY